MMDNFIHILVVDDDYRIRKLLKQYLVNNEFYISSAKNTKEANILLNEFQIDLIILDNMMPDQDGISYTKEVRENSDIPIIMLTAKGENADKIQGLEAKVDDYITKPFEPKELLLRIKRLLDRTKKKETIFKFLDFSFNLVNNVLSKGSSQINLSDTEAKLLNILIKNKEKILSRESIAQTYGNINIRSVDVQIIRLRNKIEKNPRAPVIIRTVRNKGYIFAP